MREIVLLRGLPGAGKSTLAAILAGGDAPVISVDDYFMKEGKYQFKFDENHLAYKSCEDRTREHMEKGSEKIFIDNTFTMDWEMAPYFKMASEYNYRLHVITVENHHNGKNTHDVSDEQLMKMAEKYKVKLI